jgi:hypothetical protein
MSDLSNPRIPSLRGKVSAEEWPYRRPREAIA